MEGVEPEGRKRRSTSKEVPKMLSLTKDMCVLWGKGVGERDELRGWDWAGWE